MPRCEENCEDLLRRVVAAGKAERFQYAEVVAPRDRSRLRVAFDRLLDAGLVERVTEGGCRWHYRLTPAGIAGAVGVSRETVRADLAREARSR